MHGRGNSRFLSAGECHVRPTRSYEPLTSENTALVLVDHQVGRIVSDYASLMVEILKDNARPEAGAVYDAMDMPWAKLVGQIAHAYGK